MKNFSKKLFLTTMLVIVAASIQVVAQIKLQLPQVYQQRELNISPALKAALAAQRKEITDKKLEYVVGVTSVSGKSIESITGEKGMPDMGKIQSRMAKRSQALKGLTLPPNTSLEGAVPCASQPKYDARTLGIVPPIREQMCGSCWTYGAIGAYEINFNKVNQGGAANPNIDLSEQFALSCSGGGDCSGGLAYKVLDWLVDNNKKVRTEAQMPMTGTNSACPANTIVTDYEAEDWGIVDPSGDINKIAPVNLIKAAICQYGSVSASVMATASFQNYGGGTYFGFTSNPGNPETNHAIVIVGWDDSKGAWLIRNSWGPTPATPAPWGENGYMWIKYNSNNIGKRAAWVRAKKVCSKFAGTWKNTDPNTSGLTKIIAETNGTPSIHAYGQCSPTDCDWGTATAIVLPPMVPYEYAVIYKDAAAKRCLYIDLDCNDTKMTVVMTSDYHDSRPTRTDTYTFRK